jgi:hypothetical protein
MKKLILAAVLILLLFGIIDYKYTRGKYKDIPYAVEHHLTTGIFKTYKLKNIESLVTAFSDGKLAVVTVAGTQSAAPYKKVKYQVLIERSDNDIWKIIKVYSIPY